MTVFLITTSTTCLSLLYKTKTNTTNKESHIVAGFCNFSMGTVYNSFLGHSHHHSSSSVSPSPQQKKSYTLPRRSSSAPSRLSSLNSQLPVQRKRKPSTMNNSVGQVLNSVVHLPRKLVCGRDDPSSPVAHTSEKRSAAPSRSSAGSELFLDKRSLISSSRKGSYESSCGPDSRPVTPPNKLQRL